MGIASAIKGIFVRKAVKLSNGDELIHSQSHYITQQIGRKDYVTLNLHETVFLKDTLEWFLQDIDLDTVFICGGYATFLAGYTNTYGDVDFFCTSKMTYDSLTSRLDAREDKSLTVAAGCYNGTAVNIVYCPDAYSIESILDSFDMTWCRAAIDLQERCIVVHPDIDSELPIFDTDVLMSRNNITPGDLINRLYARYQKYKERRIKPCPTVDNEVRLAIVDAVTKQPPAQNTQKVFDQSY